MTTYPKQTTTWASPAGMALAWTRAHISRAIRRVRYKLGIIDRYVVRSRHEWAIIYIDEELGSFQCQSTCGTYAYIWRSIGTDTLKQFLCGLNFDYFMGKTRPGYMRFDFDRSIENLKYSVTQARREQRVDKEAARKAFDEIEWITGDEGTSASFVQSIADSDELMELLGSEYYEVARDSPDSDSRQFWAVIWPAFLEQIGGRRR